MGKIQGLNSSLGTKCSILVGKTEAKVGGKGAQPHCRTTLLGNGLHARACSYSQPPALWQGHVQPPGGVVALGARGDSVRPTGARRPPEATRV